MMSLMSKLSITTILLLSSLHANINDKDIVNFEKQRLKQSTKLNLKDVQVYLKQKVEPKNWYGYVLNVKAEFNGKNINAKDIVFTDGTTITTDLFDIKTGKSYKDAIAPKLTNAYYNDGHLIAGNITAKNTIVIFSDPLCPFCIDYVPEVIKYVKKNPNVAKLYYYHFPLEQIHPAAVTMVKAMTALKLNKQMQDIELKFYQTNFESYFAVNERDETKILEGINKAFKTKLTLKDIQNPAVVAEVSKDIQMGEDVMVPGTPTIFINGEVDKTKKKYEFLGK